MTIPPTPSPSQPSQEAQFAMELAAQRLADARDFITKIRISEPWTGAWECPHDEATNDLMALIDAHTAGLRREGERLEERDREQTGELCLLVGENEYLRADLARLTAEQRAVKAACNFDISGDSSVETTVRRQYALLCDTIRQCKQLELRVRELERSQA